MHFSSRACREPLVCMMKKVLFYSFTIVLIVIWWKYTICAKYCFPKFVGNVCFLDSNSRNLTQKRKKRFFIYLFVRFLFIRSSGFGQMNQSPNYLATRKKSRQKHSKNRQNGDAKSGHTGLRKGCVRKVAWRNHTLKLFCKLVENLRSLGYKFKEFDPKIYLHGSLFGLLLFDGFH